MFFVLSQNREKLYNMSKGNIRYSEMYDYKDGERIETPRHVIVISHGVGEIAEYDTKEDCLKVIEMCAFAIRNNTSENTVYSMPTKEQLPDMAKAHEQLVGM